MTAPIASNGVAIFDTHGAADAAIRTLQHHGFDMRTLSIIGRDYQSEEHAVGFYTAGSRMRRWGKLGAFWGGVFGVLFGPALFWTPGVGASGSILVAALAGGVLGAAIGATANVLAAAVASLRIPNDGVVRYEAEIRPHEFVLITSGTTAEVERARTILDEVNLPRAASVVSLPDASSRSDTAFGRITAATYGEIVHETVPGFDVFRVTPATASAYELEIRVRAALRDDPRLDHTNIDVSAHGSRIWLTGSTRGPGAAAYAECVAKRIAGVTAVYNKLSWGV